MKPYWLLPVLLTLTGCERGFVVTVSGPPSQPTFELHPFKTFGVLAGPQPAIDYLFVTAEDAATPARAVWVISRSPSCTPTHAFRYGVAPRGYEVSTAPAPLIEGVVYRVSMSGCGFSGGVIFKAVGGRIVQVEGTGDEPGRRVRAAA